MPRVPRREEFSPLEVSVVHCTNRCVRQAFLCGFDSATGRDYGHRKGWIEERLEFLALWFAMDVLGYAILDNHFHLILRNRPDIVSEWSDKQVARRWLMLCPRKKSKSPIPAEPTEEEIKALIRDKRKLREIRNRLSDVSWFMKMLDEKIARLANEEEGITGRFWNGRFHMTRLCDTVAILACLMYVDLNVVRAGIAKTPETSRHTSANRRIDRFRRGAAVEKDWLSPLELCESRSPGPMICRSGRRCSDKGVLPMSLPDYLMLLDWTGRQRRANKTGSIPSDLEPILKRLGLAPCAWISLTMSFDKLFYRVAGSCQTVAMEAQQKRGRRWYKAPGSHLLSTSAA